jgi:arylsulfatase A-like enzyme
MARARIVNAESPVKCFPAPGGLAGLATMLGLLATCFGSPLVAAERRPNVVLIVTDDQGYGDLGAHGNSILRTPNLDRLAAQSLEFTHFFVSPVCAPTRSSLLSGRYNYRTRVTDTYLGRAMMDPGETTLAEYLADCGYRTAIIGKWHLGDNYPMRPMDQGFQHSLVHRGGGIGQPSDPPGGTSYFDPILFRNGQAERQQGYVSDVLTDEAIRFIDEHRSTPFFLYLAYNAPHTPLEVPERYHALYRGAEFGDQKFDQDTIARIYGMVSNIDDNIGRLLAKLDETQLTGETIVIFLTDNGPQQPRFNAGLRGQKGTVYEGGIRVPFFLRWPGHVMPGKVDQMAAHIDVVPTLLEACGCEPKAAAPLDGISLWPVMRDPARNWPDRTLFFQWHRGDVPQRYRAFAARTAQWKLLRAEPRDLEAEARPEEFELYRIGTDPGETHNVAGEHPEVVERLRRAYDQWFDDVSATRGFDPPRIVLGAQENPAVLTRQDWRGSKAGWSMDSVGHWLVEFAEPGHYQFGVRFPSADAGQIILVIGDKSWLVDAQPLEETPVGPIELSAGPATIKASRVSGDKTIGAHQITVERLKDGDTSDARKSTSIRELAHEGQGNDGSSESAVHEFFEKQVRPILAGRCHECHGPRQQKGNLRLDSRRTVLAGGDTGPAVVPGKPDESLLVDAIRYGDLYQMPPKSQLPAEEIEILVEWVRLGAPWPEEAQAGATQGEFNSHQRAAGWCFQPLVDPSIPATRHSAWPRTDMDRFVLAGLEAAHLTPAEEADKRTWLRRVTYDLIGLPPTRDEIVEFLSDESPHAYEHVVERLLASPHYGERWGRHWLDLVRFAETYGHEFDRDIPNAYRYRDYVIRAFNDDLPYDQFVLEHLAGDRVDPPRRNESEGINESILGTGFFFFGEAKHSPVDVRRDEADRIDNQIDVLCKTFLALTVSCARCHDHKFDPITTKDYYALAGFLQSSRYQQAFIDLPEVFQPSLSKLLSLANDERRQWEQLIALVKHAPSGLFADFFDTLADEAELAEAAKVPADPLHVYALLRAAEPKGEEALAEVKSRLAQQFVAGQAGADPSSTPLADLNSYDGWYVTGHAFGDRPARPGEVVLIRQGDRAAWEVIEAPTAHSGMLSTRLHGVLRSETFTIEKPRILYRLYGTGGRVRLILDGLQLIQDPIYGGLEFVPQGRHPAWHAQEVSKWIGHRAYVEIVDDGDGYIAVEQILQSAGDPPAESMDPTVAALLNDPMVLSPSAVEDHFGAALRDAAEKFSANRSVDRFHARLLGWSLSRLASWRRSEPLVAKGVGNLQTLIERRRQMEARIPLPRMAPAMADGTGENERVFIRGNPKNLGDEAPRRNLEILSGTDQPAPSRGSGRLELARRWIEQSRHLLARVMVNRVWQHHFGQGLVPTPDDFGAMGQPPTNRALLDFLAGEFIREGWSLKHLHRKIVLSSAYRMSSRPRPDASVRDPRNHLLHHVPVRRLEAECIRDALLAVSSRLDRTLYGASIPPCLNEFMSGRGRPEQSGPLDGNGRRSIYINVRRNFLTPMLLAFDYPTPFTTIGRRGESSVPAQALTMLNNPFVRQQAKRWAERIEAGPYTSDVERVAAMYEMAFARLPEPDESEIALRFLREQAMGKADERDSSALVELAHVLLNLKEFIFIH